MRQITRRRFLEATAKAAAAGLAAPVLAHGWSVLPSAAVEAGYFEREFGISDALCRKILGEALSRGGDFADVFFEHTVSNWIVLEDGKVNRAVSDIALGAGIRTVKGDQVGYGFTQELTESAMITAAGTAATIASGTAGKAVARSIAVKNLDSYPLEKRLSSVPLESKLPLVLDVNEKCFDRSPLVVKVTAQFHDQERRILVVSSDGRRAEDLQPRSYLAAFVVAEKNGRREQFYANLGGRRGFDFYTSADVEEIARKAVDDAVILFDAVQPPAGEIPVVLGPGVTGVLLHEAIGHGMEADFNRKNVSTYATMIGKKVAEPFVTIVDDGTLPHMLGSINIDDEGIPGQRTVLVENGILRSYMHDRISARHYGLEPTGNGRRQSYQHYPVPRMRNTYMEAGPAGVEDVIRRAGNGIYVQDVSNGEVHIGEGDFAFYVSQGRMIENGKLGAPIKDVNIMGNGPRMLRNIILVGNDFEMSRGGMGACGKSGQAVPCGFGQPTCLVKSLTVGGVKS
ncbi:MAG: TldD/PmbA family protein [Acidobacteriota bacterium]|nr:TldD/PmbA family protein [Acidobacteriota bacterium]